MDVFLIPIHFHDQFAISFGNFERKHDTEIRLVLLDTIPVLCGLGP
jgi:hypothetical protein